jgi:hypothetical protein
MMAGTTTCWCGLPRGVSAPGRYREGFPRRWGCAVRTLHSCGKGSRVPRGAFERLELHEGKLSCAVLRGGGGGNATSLPGAVGFPGYQGAGRLPHRNAAVGLRPAGEPNWTGTLAQLWGQQVTCGPAARARRPGHVERRLVRRARRGRGDRGARLRHRLGHNPGLHRGGRRRQPPSTRHRSGTRRSAVTGGIRSHPPPPGRRDSRAAGAVWGRASGEVGSARRAGSLYLERADRADVVRHPGPVRIPTAAGPGDVAPRGRHTARPGGSAGDFDAGANGRGR